MTAFRYRQQLAAWQTWVDIRPAVSEPFRLPLNDTIEEIGENKGGVISE